MSEARDLIVATAGRLLDDAVTPELLNAAEGGSLARDLWQVLSEAGVTNAVASESRGGSGADLGDALALVREGGRVSLPLPLAEALEAELLLASAGLPPRQGILTVATVLPSDTIQLRRSAGVWRLGGTLCRVPWGRHADGIVAIAASDEGFRTVVAPGTSRIRPGQNWAQEPRDDVIYEGEEILAEAVGAPLAGYCPDDLRLLGALFRTFAMLGALDRVLDLTLDFAKTRVQFGRVIGKFQAVQQEIAVLASQVAAAAAAGEAAAGACDRGLAPFEIAAAKVRAGESAQLACGIAHRVHAAMGFSHEYPLHRSTRRLWSWQEEFGSSEEWAAWIGAQVCAAGGGALWPMLTDDRLAKG